MFYEMIRADACAYLLHVHAEICDAAQENQNTRELDDMGRGGIIAHLDTNCAWAWCRGMRRVRAKESRELTSVTHQRAYLGLVPAAHYAKADRHVSPARGTA